MGRRLFLIPLGSFIFMISLVQAVGQPAITLSGQYTVGSTGADFASIAEALTAYEDNFVVGDVTFLLQSQTFNETFELDGLDSEFHLTIRGTDRDLTVIDASGTSGSLVEGRNAGIGIQEVENVTLENFTLNAGTLDDAIHLYRTTTININDISYTRVGAAGNYTVFVDHSELVSIDNCEFTEFTDRAISIESSDSVTIENSTFSGYTVHGITWDGGEDRTIFIRNNFMESSAATDEDIFIQWPGSGGFEISGNTINGSVFAAVGDRFASVHNNIINSQDNIAFELYAIGPYGNGNVSVYNNIFSSSTDLGFISQQLGFRQLSFINNTVISGGNPSGSIGILAAENVLSDQTFTVDLVIVNNIFQGNSTAALNIAVQNGEESSTMMDHNLFYSDIDAAVSTTLFDLNGVALTPGDYTLTEWQTVFSSSFDQNSQGFEPVFVSGDDFHITNNTNYRFGTYTDSLLYDIDGDNRTGFVVDVGADQFKSDVTLSGEYIVGTSAGADYITIKEAINDYRDATITGDVTFLLQAETFEENVDLGFLSNEEYHLIIKGSDRENSIIQVKEDETVLLSQRNINAGLNPNGAAGIGIDESKNITLENFTLRGKVSSLERTSVGVYVWDSDDIAVKSVNFEDENDLSVFNHASRSMLIEACDFSGPVNTAVFDFVSKSGELIIRDNRFSNYTRRAVLVSSSSATVIAEGNTFSSNVNSLVSIQYDFEINAWFATFLNNTTSEGRVQIRTRAGSVISGNRIISGDGVALSLGSEGVQSISNNFLKSNVSSAVFDGSGITNFIHNTVIGTEAAAFDFFGTAENGNELNILNNIFVGEGSPALDFTVYTESELVNLDYNLIYSDTDEAVSTDLFTIDDVSLEVGAFTFEDWQAVFSNSFDQNSRSFTPQFIADDDLHITHGIDYRFGSYIDSLAMDLDGDLRLDGNVDVGADQYVCELSSSSVIVKVFDQYVWDGTVLNESGSYPRQVIDEFGCESAETLELTILSLTSASLILVEENTDGVFYTITLDEDVALRLGGEKDEEWFSLEGTELRFVNTPDFESPFDGPGGDNDYFIDVIATDTEDNSSTIQIIVSVIDVRESVVLGVDEEFNTSMFYPNPVRDHVFFHNEEDKNIRVLTLDGRILINQKAKGFVDLSGLKQGPYLIEINDGVNQAIERIIKKE